MIFARTLLLAVAVGGALAAAPCAAAGSRTGRPACDALVVHEPRQLRDSLLELSAPVLGKPPLAWTEDDFDRIYRTADYCDGVRDPSTNSVIRAATWRSNLDPAREAVLSASATLRDSDAFRKNGRTKAVVLPPCERLLEWSHDPRDFRNNSAAIFGRDVLETPLEDFDLVMGYVKSCAPALFRIAHGRLKLREDETQRRLQSILDVYTTVHAAHTERRAGGNRATDMIAYMDGRPVPSTLASRRTQSLVRELDRYAASRQRLPADQIESMNREATAIAAEAKTRIETVWAEAVKERISRDIFSEQP